MIPGAVLQAVERLAPPSQEVRFCRSRDDVRLAYAVHGSGPPLVVVSCWLSHLQHDWASPVWRHFLEDLGAISTLVRYDERGFGMSDWDVTDFSLEARLADLEAIIDALGIERFALLGMSGGTPVAMAYALAHPDRVSRMILYGTSNGRPWPVSEEGRADDEAFRAMIRAGWARSDPRFRRVFTSIFIPDATEEQMSWFDALQRMSTSTQNALLSRTGRQTVDIGDELPRIQVPTLVLQALGDQAGGFDQGREVASQIPGARLVPLDSRNHILLADEPAWAVFMDEVRAFLEPDRRRGSEDRRPIADLSARELAVLRLAADGLSNQEIAGALTLSVRTVERHLSNLYSKLGVAGRSARTAVVADFLRRTG